MRKQIYIKKEARDNKVKELKTQGYKVKRTSIRNQLMHPEYITDYPYKISDSDRGFGNELYKTYFSVLYSYEIINEMEVF